MVPVVRQPCNLMNFAARVGAGLEVGQGINEMKCQLAWEIEGRGARSITNFGERDICATVFDRLPPARTRRMIKGRAL